MSLKYKSGDKVVIGANTCDHRFNLGEIVVISEVVTKNNEYIAYRLQDRYFCWWIQDEDISGYALTQPNK